MVIVPEAAEVLEMYTVTTVGQASKHLMHNGDHQQVRNHTEKFNSCLVSLDSV